MRIVSFEHKITQPKRKDIFHVGVNTHSRQSPRFSFKLLLHIGNLIYIDMGIADKMNELFCFHSDNLSNHHEKERVFCGIKRNADRDIAAVLAENRPLLAVEGAEIARLSPESSADFRSCPCIPKMNSEFFSQIANIGTPRKKPKKFSTNSPPRSLQAAGSNERESFIKIETHTGTRQRNGVYSLRRMFDFPATQNFVHKIQVLPHIAPFCQRSKSASTLARETKKATRKSCFFENPKVKYYFLISIP